MPRLSQHGCAARRQRLLDLLLNQRLDVAFLTDIRDVYYFTGTLLPANLPVALAIAADGKTLFIGPDEFEPPSVDQVVQYQWNYRGTRHPDVAAHMLAAVDDAWQAFGTHRIGVQQRSLLDCVRRLIEPTATGELVPIDTHLAWMQQRKDADELTILRESIRVNLAAYDAVAREIRPGVSELDVLAAGQRGAMRAAGEKVFHDGDYQCGQYNGPARNRKIEAGELYIVDAWTCYRGYWSDMARTFVVGQAVTDVQQTLFENIARIQSEAASLLRPGIDGCQVYRALDEMIREHPLLADGGLIHHGGHAIGLRSHEMPDINLQRGGILEPGNVICIEPGGYFEAARYGVRLENMYLITESGCENLCPGKLELIVCR
jgi:Xaa-Pro aminopeptidase